MSILVLNAGSSTLKFALFDNAANEEFCCGTTDWQGKSESVADAVDQILLKQDETGFQEPIQAVGHRVVHGGREFPNAVLVNADVRDRLQNLSLLAPIHLPRAIESMTAIADSLPDIPQVAVFDTSYFHDLPERRFIYPVPYDWYEQFGIRRFGFHGISYEYCGDRVAELLCRTQDETLRLVVCHLGSGASATAIQGGTPVATTMGFTPIEGLMMGTRSGSVDPGILLHLLDQHGFDSHQMNEALNRRSGLLGVSGVSSDFRKIEQAADTGNHRAQLAIDLFVDRVRSAIGSLAVTLGGVDGLVFTAGIGENSAMLRANVCAGLQCLGLEIDYEKNLTFSADCCISSSDSTGKIFVVRTREDKMIANKTRQLLANVLPERRKPF